MGEIAEALTSASTGVQTERDFSTTTYVLTEVEVLAMQGKYGTELKEHSFQMQRIVLMGCPSLL